MTRKEKMRYALYVALLYPVSLLPLRVLYGVSSLLSMAMERVFHYRREVVETNLRECFPEKSPEELKRIKKEFYRSLADNIVETVKLLTISRRNLKKRVKVANPEVADELLRRGKPVILYLGHYGNWEWMTALTLSMAPTDGFLGHIYRDQKDAAMNRVLDHARNRTLSRGIELKRAVREILGHYSRNTRLMVGFISDHRFNSASHKEGTMFLNHITPYYTGGETIGNKIGAEYLYADVEKTARGHYRLTYVPVTPADDKPHPITRRYMQLMEKTIRRDPPYWLWSHKRWIGQVPAEIY